MTNPSAVAEGRKLVEVRIRELQRTHEKLTSWARTTPTNQGEHHNYLRSAAQIQKDIDAIRAFLSHVASIEQQLAALREAVSKLKRHYANEGGYTLRIGDGNGPLYRVCDVAEATASLFDRSPETSAYE